MRVFEVRRQQAQYGQVAKVGYLLLKNGASYLVVPALALYPMPAAYLAGGSAAFKKSFGRPCPGFYLKGLEKLNRQKWDILHRINRIASAANKMEKPCIYRVVFGLKPENLHRQIVKRGPVVRQGQYPLLQAI